MSVKKDPTIRILNLESILHPMELLRRLSVASPVVAQSVLEFRSFKFEPGKYDEGSQYIDKEVFCIPANQLRHVSLHAFFGRANAAGNDVVLLSRIVDGEGRVWHIPMIDFACPLTAQEIRLAKRWKVDEVAAIDWNYFWFYNSGRSFHAYGNMVLSPNAWMEFMGRTLLLNDLRFQQPLTDTRWTGHQLIRGHAGLRWTCNNPKYIRVPSQIVNPFDAPFVPNVVSINGMSDPDDIPY